MWSHEETLKQPKTTGRLWQVVQDATTTYMQGTFKNCVQANKEGLVHRTNTDFNEVISVYLILFIMLIMNNF